VHIIDHRQLRYKLIFEDLKTPDDTYSAIKQMHVRGSGLIGATGTYETPPLAPAVKRLILSTPACNTQWL